MTPTQFRNLVRQEEARRRQAINRYNAAVNKYNGEVKRAVNGHNAEVRKNKQAVDRYNRDARAHNARVRADRARLAREVSRLQTPSGRQHFVEIQRSSLTLHEAFRTVDVDADAAEWGATGNHLVDLAETEAANSAAVSNLLLGRGTADPELDSTGVIEELKEFSLDLDSRWRGALFSIHPNNPDAARHFCTSAREILVQILEISAPDDLVKSEFQDCRLTQEGRPIRRDKIRYLLERDSTHHESLGNFVDSDIDDVVGLFRVFNDGTHGDAGTLDISALRGLKGRVEGAIRFLSTIARPS